MKALIELLNVSILNEPLDEGRKASKFVVKTSKAIASKLGVEYNPKDPARFVVADSTVAKVKKAILSIPGVKESDRDGPKRLSHGPTVIEVGKSQNKGRVIVDIII